MGISSRGRTALPPVEASLEREAALTVSSQSTPPSARVSNIDGFSWVIDEPVLDMLGGAFFVIENDVFLGDMGVHSQTGGSRPPISQVAAVVLAWANTLTPSAATRLRKIMIDVRKTGDVGGEVLVVQHLQCWRWRQSPGTGSRCSWTWQSCEAGGRGKKAGGGAGRPRAK